ncbi:MAG: purine-nucleoside phosphorylase [Eubacteriales bacterium]|jgi:purine-nucleoside phosphorylase|nr:purine-nucleoside phosphorylase [Eubacteriales bacterium]
MLSYEKAKASADFILNKIKIVPKIAIILGSGLSDYHQKLDEKIEIPYSQIPDFPEATAIGHKSKLVFGKIGSKYVIMMCGRFHCYEGYSMEQAAFPVYVLKLMGVETLVVTNAAGCINEEFDVGQLMVIKDHIKLVIDSPLRGINDERLGPRFNDMSFAYSPRLRDLAKEVAYGLGLTLREGVYAFMPGPSYETPAEIKALSILGADAVGMSTVPEVIAASHCGLEVLGLSMLTNMAAGILDQPLSHEEVIEAGKNGADYFAKLIDAVIERL